MSAVYNPLLDTFTADAKPTWHTVSEAIQLRVERAAKRGNVAEGFKALAELDLIDSEAAAYWRETGWDLYSA